MKKEIKHIWRYLTSPLYRVHCDLLHTQMAYDALMNLLKENSRINIMPPLEIRESLKKINKPK